MFKAIVFKNLDDEIYFFLFVWQSNVTQQQIIVNFVKFNFFSKVASRQIFKLCCTLPNKWSVKKNFSKEMKKITAPIEYTRTMQERVFKPHSETNLTYNLVAVLIHQGTSTKCGHYYDVIKYPHNNLWYTFNDKVIKIKNRLFILIF